VNKNRRSRPWKILKNLDFFHFFNILRALFGSLRQGHFFTVFLGHLIRPGVALNPRHQILKIFHNFYDFLCFDISKITEIDCEYLIAAPRIVFLSKLALSGCSLSPGSEN